MAKINILAGILLTLFSSIVFAGEEVVVDHYGAGPGLICKVGPFSKNKGPNKLLSHLMPAFVMREKFLGANWLGSTCEVIGLIGSDKEVVVWSVNGQKHLFYSVQHKYGNGTCQFADTPKYEFEVSYEHAEQISYDSKVDAPVEFSMVCKTFRFVKSTP